MKHIIEFLTIFSWIIGPVCLIFGVIGIYLQSHYNDSLEEKLDAIKGIRKNYNHTSLKLLFVFLICLTFLITKYTI
jgi:hypothetical protein